MEEMKVIVESFLVSTHHIPTPCFVAEQPGDGVAVSQDFPLLRLFGSNKLLGQQILLMEDILQQLGCMKPSN